MRSAPVISQRRGSGDDRPHGRSIDRPHVRGMHLGNPGRACMRVNTRLLTRMLTAPVWREPSGIESRHCSSGSGGLVSCIPRRHHSAPLRGLGWPANTGDSMELALRVGSRQCCCLRTSDAEPNGRLNAKAQACGQGKRVVKGVTTGCARGIAKRIYKRIPMRLFRALTRGPKTCVGNSPPLGEGMRQRSSVLMRLPTHMAKGRVVRVSETIAMQRHSGFARSGRSAHWKLIETPNTIGNRMEHARGISTLHQVLIVKRIGGRDGKGIDAPTARRIPSGKSRVHNKPIRKCIT